MAYNWAAFGMGSVGAGLKLGADIVQIGMNELSFAAKNIQATASLTQSMANQGSYKSQAKSFRIAAQDAVKAAGRVQEQGRQAREMRLVQLGQDKGRIVASAAGSGIEASSKVVSKVLKDTVKSAYNDTEVIAQNEKQMAQEKLNESLAMQINAVRADANADIEGLNQSLILEQIKLNNRAARHAMIGGIMSATGNFISGIGGATAMGAMGNAAS